MADSSNEKQDVALQTEDLQAKKARAEKRGPNASGKCADGFRRAIQGQTTLGPRMLPFITAKGIQGGIGNKNCIKQAFFSIFEIAGKIAGHVL